MAETNLLLTPRFRQAVAGIELRAEKQLDWQRVSDVFVRTDLFDRVNTPRTQLVLGRRGTGKTHLLRAARQEAMQRGGLAVFLDCTRLGSGYASLELGEQTVAQKYFVTFFNQLGTELFEYAIRLELAPPGKEDKLLRRLTDGLVPLMRAANGAGSTFNYRQIAQILEEFLVELGNQRLMIILDEWAQVPFMAQPHLAEYLKRGVLAVPQVGLKLLAVNYQCQFQRLIGADLVGLQRGADIPDVIDMDRYLVYDEKRDFVADFFAHLLYNHLAVELEWDLTVDEPAKRKQVERLFTQQRAFIELVRAAEGNCRDFLCIFARAYFDEFRQTAASASISIANVQSAAASWYDTEKAATINTEPSAKETLAFLWHHVLKNYRSRTFLVESSKADHPLLTRLLNERVLHKLNGTYSHQDRPGILHDLFTIDYGAYVRFRGTVNEVNEQVFWEPGDLIQLTEEQRELLVPADDKRSIRRITFDPVALATDPQAIAVAGDAPPLPGETASLF